MAIYKPLHARRVTVWCAMSSAGIIGPVFLDESITGVVYRKILEEFIPFMYGMERVMDNWFMQDGARPHRTHDVFELR